LGATLEEPRLLERDAELDGIRAAVERAVAGEGGLVVVEGPAGIGKSRLLAASRRAAGAHGMAALAARGGELERDFAYGVVRQLLERPLLDAPEDERRALLSGAARLAEPALGLGLGLAADDPAPAGPGGDVSFAAAHGLYWLVSNLAVREPLLL
jgi:hypothetical protein